jgi:hypothetical protein
MGLRMSHSYVHIFTAPMGDQNVFPTIPPFFQKFTTLDSVFGYFNPKNALLFAYIIATRFCHSSVHICTVFGYFNP